MAKQLFLNLLFSTFWIKTKLKHNKHISNQNQKAFIIIIINYTFSVFQKIPTPRNKYHFYFAHRLTLFFHCLTRRPKKLTWCHLMYCLWNLFCVQFQFLKKLKNIILSSHFCLFQNSLIDLVTPKDSYFITKKV